MHSRRTRFPGGNFGRFAIAVLVSAAGGSRLCAADFPLTAEEKAEIAAAIKFSGKPGESLYSPDVLRLGVLEPESNFPPLVQRELARQAVLMAARDGLGLSTRDGALREPFGEPSKEAGAPVEVLVMQGPAERTLRVFVFRRREETECLWRGTIRWAEQESPLTAMAKACDELARGPFVAALREAGYKGEPNKVVGSGAVPEDADKLLGQLDFVSQYAAVRILHAAVRDSGESPERLAALSAAYAMLGSLVESCVSPAHRALKARSLLYAERAVVQSKAGPAALWNRARVRTIVGLHAAALEDVTAARNAGENATPKFTEPAWGVAVEAACRFDARKFADLKNDKAVASVATYLNLLNVNILEGAARRSRAVAECLDANPDCTRPVDVLWTIGSLGLKRTAATEGGPLFVRGFYPRLGSVPGLPDSVRQIAKEQLEDSENEGDEHDRRVRILKEIQAAGTAGHDTAEPSLAVLSQLAREIGFLNSCYRVDFLKKSLAVDCRDELAAVESLIDGHPCAALLRTFPLQAPSVRAQLQKLVKTLEPAEAEYTGIILAGFLYDHDWRIWNRWLDRAALHSDETARDLVLLSYNLPKENRDAALRRLRKASPHVPRAVAFAVRTEWATLEKQAAELEQRHELDDEVLEALAQRHEDDRRFEDAERCYRRSAESEPTTASYRALADYHERRGQMDQWQRALEDALTTPAAGLEHTGVRSQIARHFLNRGEFDKALPFAEEAAQSYAAWAMEVAVLCHERLGNWKEAETWQRRISERYENQRIDWYYWCMRTGKGDRKAAHALATKFFESIEAPATSQMMFSVGVYYLFDEKPEEALEAFQESFRSSPDVLSGLHAALLADQQKDEGLRDKLLNQTIKVGEAQRKNGTGHVAILKIAEAWQSAIERRKSDPGFRLNAAAFERGRFRDPAGQCTRADYFLSRILQRFGQTDEARKYALRAATSPAVDAAVYSGLAATELRAANVSIGPMRLHERPTDIEAIDSFAHRTAAEWVIENGGSVIVHLESHDTHDVKALPIPRERFRLLGVQFAANTKLADESLQNLSRAFGLSYVSIDCPLSGEGLQSLSRIETLETLKINGNNLSDAGMQAIGALSGLRTLTSVCTSGQPSLTRGGLSPIRRLAQLENLTLEGFVIDDDGMAVLADLTAMNGLILSSSKRPIPQVTDAGLGHLTKLAKLQTLSICGSRITDDGLRNLSKMTDLRKLTLSNNRITGAGFQPLSFPELTSLDLSGCDISEAGLAELARMKKLAVIDLTGVKLKSGALQSLQKSLPNCRIATTAKLVTE